VDRVSEEVAQFEANLLHGRHTASIDGRDEDFQSNREVLARAHAQNGRQAERVARCHRARPLRIASIVCRANGENTTLARGLLRNETSHFPAFVLLEQRGLARHFVTVERASQNPATLEQVL